MHVEHKRTHIMQHHNSLDLLHAKKKRNEINISRLFSIILILILALRTSYCRLLNSDISPYHAISDGTLRNPENDVIL